jgi:hypothetical protein
MQAAHTPASPGYPARLEGRLDRPSRALWLVKWLLLVPHYVCLAFLWLSFVVLSLAAFLVLLFGGGYPRGIFDFNVGVLRWTWRVAFYAFGANGTDRYPPFTLADVPDYPARLEIDYPATQRHGLPLIGWWLAGVPQYLVAGVIGGAGAGIAWQVTERASWRSGSIGLVDLLVFYAVLALLFTGRYPRSLFDLVLGLNRWLLRVGAYAALLTREYPPFRLDAGERDLLLASAVESAGAASPADRRVERWSVGRVLALVAGCLAVAVAVAAAALGVTALVFDQTQRDAAGYLMTHARPYDTPTYALVSDSYRAGAWTLPRDVLGSVRLRTESTAPVFLGIGPAASVDAYLAGVRREVAGHSDARSADFRLHAGGPPPASPTAQSFWVARTTGTGSQTLTWKPRSGSWRVVLMSPDGGAGVSAELAVGARFPHLLALGMGAVGFGVLVGAAGVVVVYAAVRRRADRREEP